MPSESEVVEAILKLAIVCKDKEIEQLRQEIERLGGEVEQLTVELAGERIVKATQDRLIALIKDIKDAND